MTVYVDNMRRPARVGRTSANWSHLFADTPAELRRFVERLGLRREWLQHGGTHREHYDVTDTVRKKALDLGAVAIGYPSQVGRLLEARRQVCRCTTLAGCRWAQAVTS